MVVGLIVLPPLQVNLEKICENNRRTLEPAKEKAKMLELPLGQRKKIIIKKKQIRLKVRV